MNGRSRVSLFRKPTWGVSLLILAGLVLAACQPAATPSPTTTPTLPPAATTVAVPVTGVEAVVSISTDAKLGKLLVDGKGMTLYAFTKDTPNQSNCTGTCLANWPPLLTSGNPKLGDGVDPSLVGSAALADGSKIVTYNQMPLYTFAKDAKAGDVNGQGVGSVWYAVSPDGKMIGQEAASGTPSAPAAATQATINVATDPNLGKILVDGKGLTLYVFTKDEPDKSNCIADCLKAWPPLLSQGGPNLGDGVDASLVGTATLADGSKIVTYNHMPLYYYAKDTKPGDTTGQNIGSVWFAVSPDGKPMDQ